MTWNIAVAAGAETFHAFGTIMIWPVGDARSPQGPGHLSEKILLDRRRFYEPIHSDCERKGADAESRNR